MLKIAVVIPTHSNIKSSLQNLLKVYEFLIKKYKIKVTIFTDSRIDFSYKNFKVQKIKGFDHNTFLEKILLFLGLQRNYYPELVENLKDYDAYKNSNKVNEASNDKSKRTNCVKSIKEQRRLVRDWADELVRSYEELKDALINEAEKQDKISGSKTIDLFKPEFEERLKELDQQIKDIEFFLTKGSGSFENFFDFFSRRIFYFFFERREVPLKKCLEHY